MPKKVYRAAVKKKIIKNSEEKKHIWLLSVFVIYEDVTDEKLPPGALHFFLVPFWQRSDCCQIFGIIYLYPLPPSPPPTMLERNVKSRYYKKVVRQNVNLAQGKKTVHLLRVKYRLFNFRGLKTSLWRNSQTMLWFQNVASVNNHCRLYF